MVTVPLFVLLEYIDNQTYVCDKYKMIKDWIMQNIKYICIRGCCDDVYSQSVTIGDYGNV